MGDIKRTRFERNGVVEFEFYGDLTRSRDWWNSRLEGSLPIEGAGRPRQGPFMNGNPNELLTLAQVEKELTDGEFDSVPAIVDDRTDGVRVALPRVPAKKLK